MKAHYVLRLRVSPHAVMRFRIAEGPALFSGKPKETFIAAGAEGEADKWTHLGEPHAIGQEMRDPSSTFL